VIGGVGDRSGENYSQPWERRGKDDLAQTALAIEVVGEARGLVAPREAGAVAHGTLRIDVDEQRLHSASRKSGGQIHCSGGFANSSLLAYDSEDSTHLL